MRQTRFLRRRGSVAEILLVLVVVFVLVLIFWGLVIRPRPRPEYAKRVKQVAQLHSINTATELFCNEFGRYPPSDANDPVGGAYCGAMKLAEAVMGQDLLGFHRDSQFRLDGTDPNTGQFLYDAGPESLNVRSGPYLLDDSANASRLVDIYGEGNTGPFREHVWVLCDTYERGRAHGEKTRMPILYYRADPNGTTHDVNDPDNPDNIYDYRENQALLALGVPGDPSKVHPLLANPRLFYLMTQDRKITRAAKPVRADTFILISAGLDGLYGTADDICNFEWKYREP